MKKLKLNGFTLMADDGFEIEKDKDVITVSAEEPRYILVNGVYSQHFKDTITGKAVSLEKILKMLNER